MTESNPRRSILQLTHQEARQFLLKHECFCSLDLPPYFDFARMLVAINSALDREGLTDAEVRKAGGVEDASYTLLNNKDGHYAWRPFQLMHPVLYVELVCGITTEDAWASIVSRFSEFGASARIRCASIPVVADHPEIRPQADKAEQISVWWNEVEQKSIELALEYDLLYTTDIVDCYGAIYTHSIAWAMHGKDTAKAQRHDKALVGNFIDSRIQNARYGQTNGIPQGPVLSDLIAEMVLGYADELLARRIEELSQEAARDYHVIRYRDDYRIFANSSADGEMVIKVLTEVLSELGMKLNPQKTAKSDDVIGRSVKADKIDWLEMRGRGAGLQKQLLLARRHALEHPNSGSLFKELKRIYRVASKRSKIQENVDPLISIVADIALRNPRCYPVAMALVSGLIARIDDAARKQLMLQKVLRRFQRVPNTGYLEVWLQRISRPLFPEAGDASMSYDEPLCQLVEGASASLWNCDWLPENSLAKSACSNTTVIDPKKLDALQPVIPTDEVEFFLSSPY